MNNKASEILRNIVGFKNPQRIFSTFGLALLLLSGSAIAQNSTQQELDRIEKEQKTRENRVNVLEKTKSAAEQEIDALKQKLVNAALNQQKAEMIAERSEKRLIVLRAKERAATMQFSQRKQALEDVVVALIAVEKDRPPALAIKPSNATEAARVAILMRLIAPMLNAKAQQISGEIGQLRQVRQDLLMGNSAYREATLNLENSRKTVAVLITQRQDLIAKINKDAASERDVIANLAAKASGLRDLLNKIGEALPNDKPTDGSNFARGFPQARGRILTPANGIIVQKYGEKDAEGSPNNGITIRTRASAQVLSPFDGKVEFAAPFRAYGRVLIINVGDKYRIVLAGLGETYVEAGQEVLAGEPIGVMLNDDKIVPDLYLEIRHENATLNPSEWLMPNNG